MMSRQRGECLPVYYSARLLRSAIPNKNPRQLPPSRSTPTTGDWAERTMAPPQSELICDVAAEIFLRLPPDEPEHLVRASLACKPWFRLLTDPDFLRRYRAIHRTPPLLGYLQRRRAEESDPPARIFLTTKVAPLAPRPYFRRALDCHHGRVLLHAYDDDWYLLVWDPVTADRTRVPEPGYDCQIYSAAVFCAVSDCAHFDCHGGPFRVVLIGTLNRDWDHQVKACVYSSETGAWSTPVILGDDCEIYARHMQEAFDNDNGEEFEELLNTPPFVQPMRGAIIGDGVYFTVSWRNSILKYDIGQNCLCTIHPPSHDGLYVALMEMEDSALGFACVQDWNLVLWSRKVSLEGASEWIQYKVIKLQGIVPIAAPDDGPVVVGAAEGVGIIFLSTRVGLFTIKLNSRQVKKIAQPGVYFSILPYMSFYTPDCGAAIARKVRGSLIADSQVCR